MAVLIKKSPLFPVTEVGIVVPLRTAVPFVPFTPAGPVNPIGP